MRMRQIGCIQNIRYFGDEFMHFAEIRTEVVEILKATQGRFLTAYQICQRLEVRAEPTWQALIKEYPSVNVETPMGEGTGRQYSPASFVANALKHFVETSAVPNLRQELFECEGVSFNGIDPGFTRNVVGIWAICQVPADHPTLITSPSPPASSRSR